MSLGSARRVACRRRARGRAPSPVGSCDAATNVCTACDEESDCEAGEACNVQTNACEFYCFADNQCPPAQACVSGSCSPVPCLDDTACNLGSTCVNQFCQATPCTTNDDCVLGSLCEQTLQVCVLEELPGSECFESQDCSPSYGCGQGYCLRCVGNGNRCNSCTTDANCPGANLCNALLQSCVACLTDANCGAGEICFPSGECGDPCAVDADCNGSQICDEFDRCVPPALGTDCTVDGDCPTGMDCINQFCRACIGGQNACQTCNPGASQCGTDVCDFDAFVCVECREDSDCDGNAYCFRGSCEPPCFSSAECPAGSACNLLPNRCELL